MISSVNVSQVITALEKSVMMSVTVSVIMKAVAPKTLEVNQAVVVEEALLENIVLKSLNLLT